MPVTPNLLGFCGSNIWDKLNRNAICISNKNPSLHQLSQLQGFGYNLVRRIAISFFLLCNKLRMAKKICSQCTGQTFSLPLYRWNKLNQAFYHVFKIIGLISFNALVKIAFFHPEN